MDRLQGYGTNGYEYRRSQIDRSNSNRLKWMMNEAKKSAEKRELEQVQSDSSKKSFSSLTTNNTLGEKKECSEIYKNDKYFKPSSINKFTKTGLNRPFNNNNNSLK